jgi:hypothetical protein
MDADVKVGFANEGEQNLKVVDVAKWVPINVTYMNDTVFFKNDGAYFSMKREDFKKIFNL